MFPLAVVVRCDLAGFYGSVGFFLLRSRGFVKFATFLLFSVCVLALLSLMFWIGYVWDFVF